MLVLTNGHLSDQRTRNIAAVDRIRFFDFLRRLVPSSLYVLSYIFLELPFGNSDQKGERKFIESIGVLRYNREGICGRKVASSL